MRWQNYYLGLIALIAVSVSSNSYAISLPGDKFRPFVTTNFLFDSNFLRMSNSINPVSATGKNSVSEFMKQVATGFDLDWQVGRQHFVIDTNFNQNWFQNYTGLDYLGWNNTAQLNWEVGNDLDGEKP